MHGRGMERGGKIWWGGGEDRIGGRLSLGRGEGGQ